MSDRNATEKGKQHMQTAALVLTRLGDDATANGILTALVNIDHPKTERDAIRDAIKLNPVTALTVIQRGSATGLTTRVAADALDEIVDLLPKDEVHTLLADHMTEERLAELLAERRDLPSVATSVVSPKQLVDAVRLDVNASNALRTELFTVHYWAVKLHDRDDWSEICGQELLPGLTFVDAILISFLFSTHGDVTAVSADQFADVGLDAMECRERLNEFASRIDTDNENVRLAAILVHLAEEVEADADANKDADDHDDAPDSGHGPVSIRGDKDAGGEEPSTDDIAAHLDL